MPDGVAVVVGRLNGLSGCLPVGVAVPAGVCCSVWRLSAPRPDAGAGDAVATGGGDVGRAVEGDVGIGVVLPIDGVMLPGLCAPPCGVPLDIKGAAVALIVGLGVDPSVFMVAGGDFPAVIGLTNVFGGASGGAVASAFIFARAFCCSAG